MYGGSERLFTHAIQNFEPSCYITRSTNDDSRPRHAASGTGSKSTALSGLPASPRCERLGVKMHRLLSRSPQTLSNAKLYAVHYTLERNTNRGLRSEEATENRKEQRSVKRIIARRKHRQTQQSPGAPAQELHPHSPTLSLGTPYTIASHNIREVK